ncbi:two-component system, chemotaxis family, response regulator CheB [Dyella jiangningensis]|uniref:chemotaxis protein CheB n=1 Tax=Dyella sp. AtDHG13 TaxID=1938897 RepID=UPI000882F38B|nr:chemotaxis protein CheB [Dyella sp. AtDHG13]PXV58161.1 two-component system chemotaxis response regulator CheB/chemosensory pili system protein ChpB (putative protein-glutamate methylesterase) [Dyella sp. AtDHG13]SDK13509.1 two-component system, chemotaxis family, response regulator CheB [Dyella jiangningensis]
MAETATAVALLFDDVDLGSQLREALRERGARIVHEGALSTLSRQMLDATGAEVLVVNLDEEAEDELDRLYDVIDGDRPRVVFNDAAASRSLDGWDRARWARHLAVKVMAQGDLDPPRPHDAPVIPEVAAPPALSVADEPAPSFAAPLDVAEPIAPHVADATEVESESLAAELEALMAADEPVADETHAAVQEQEPLHADDFAALADLPLDADDDFGSGLKFSADDELPPLHDGNFGAATHAHEGAEGSAFDDADEPPPLPVNLFGVEAVATQGHAPLDATAHETAARSTPAFQLDHLALTPLDDSFMPATDARQASSASMLGLASSWSLVEDGETPAAAPSPAPAAPKEFGIEKLSAADFLAPEGGEEEASIIEPGMKLELVSMEEALAPKEYEGGTEMLLDDLDGAVSRLLVLGAASDSLEAVCSFLSMLPADLRVAVLHVQHLGGKTVEALCETLARHSELPVRIAGPGTRARAGEVLVVPGGHQARVHRDGRVDLQSLENNDTRSSPIDASFTLAANVFGRNAQAIVFAGQANDALGGCQAIHDRGGQVWIESSDGQYADMVHGIEAERLHSYSGTPAELAARLVDEMLMEGRR